MQPKTNFFSARQLEEAVRSFRHRQRVVFEAQRQHVGEVRQHRVSQLSQIRGHDEAGVDAVTLARVGHQIRKLGHGGAAEIQIGSSNCFGVDVGQHVRQAGDRGRGRFLEVRVLLGVDFDDSVQLGFFDYGSQMLLLILLLGF
jgi:hypothetical protein